MFNWKNKNIFLSIIVSIILILLVAVNIKYKLLTFEEIEKRKDLIDSITKIIGSILLLIGGVLTYLKFFKGSTLAEKLNIKINGRIIEYDKSSNYHIIDMELKNVGIVPMRDISIETETYCIEKNISIENIDSDIQSILASSSNVIHSQSSGAHNYIYKVPKNSKAVQNVIKIKSKKGNNWLTSFTIPNKTDYEYLNEQ